MSKKKITQINVDYMMVHGITWLTNLKFKIFVFFLEKIVEKILWRIFEIFLYLIKICDNCIIF